MGVLENDQIDAIGQRGDSLTLLITDSLSWSYEGENLEDVHLDRLQDKVNLYLTYITSGQHKAKYGNIKKFTILVTFMNGVTKKTLLFFDVLNKQIKDQINYNKLDMKIGLRFIMPENAAVRKVIDAKEGELVDLRYMVDSY